MSLSHVLTRVAKLFESRRSTLRPVLRARPTLEVLEDRTVPTLFWIGPASGTWSVAANWLDSVTHTHHIPGALDSLQFGGASSNSNSNTDDIANLSVTAFTCDSTYTGTILITQNLTVGDYLTDYGRLTLPGAHVGNGPNLTVKKDLFEYGTLSLGRNDVITVGVLYDRGSVATAAPVGTSTIAGILDVSGSLSEIGGGTLLANNFLQESTGVTTLASGSTLNANIFSSSGLITMAGSHLIAGNLLTNLGTITTSGALDSITTTSTFNNAGNITFTGTIHDLNIMGNYKGVGALNMRLGNPNGGFNDRLQVTGSASLGNGILNVTGPVNAVPGRWNLVNATISIDGAFGSFTHPAPPPGFTWTQIVTQTSLTIGLIPG